jgi:glycosyltransferase involved in cell wall biosynthesis
VFHPGAFDAAAGWHATSDKEAEDIRRLGYRQPICVAPSGIEPPADGADEVRRHFQVLAPEIAGRRVLLFHSRFHSKKRILELLADFASLAPRLPDWHLLAVGIPDQYSVAELRAEASRLGIASRASILDGSTGPAPYAIAELFSLPTHDENFGRVVAEALAAGVPVITTTGTPWAPLEAAGAGRCVEIDSFRPALEELMRTPPEALRAQGEKGRSWVLQNFQWGRSASILKGFYEELLAASRPARSAAV